MSEILDAGIREVGLGGGEAVSTHVVCVVTAKGEGGEPLGGFWEVVGVAIEKKESIFVVVGVAFVSDGAF